MAKRTSIDDVEQAVAAVAVIQEQVAGLLEAIKRLTERLEAVEAELPARKPNV